MKLPHDSVAGTFLSGAVLTLVLWLVVRHLVNRQASRGYSRRFDPGSPADDSHHGCHHPDRPCLREFGHVYVNMVTRPLSDPCKPPFSAISRYIPLYPAVFRLSSCLHRHLGNGVPLLWRSGRLADAAPLNGSDAVIGMGAWIGTIMTLNVWLVLWPHQKTVMGFGPTSFEERARCARITFLTSRTNAMLSVPLFFFMVSSSFGSGLF